MQFIRDPFAIPFPLKYDRCSLAAEAALTSMKSAVDIHHPWNPIFGLNERSLVFLQESFKQSRLSTGTRSAAASLTLIHTGSRCNYLKTITYQKAISGWIDSLDWYWKEKDVSMVLNTELTKSLCLILSFTQWTGREWDKNIQNTARLFTNRTKELY